MKQGTQNTVKCYLSDQEKIQIARHILGKERWAKWEEYKVEYTLKYGGSNQQVEEQKEKKRGKKGRPFSSGNKGKRICTFSSPFKTKLQDAKLDLARE